VGIIGKAVSSTTNVVRFKTLFNAAGVTSVVALSPTASRYIQCGSMLSDSPLPASSAASFSRSDQMDGLLLLPDISSTSDGSSSTPVPNSKGKGRAYEYGQPRGSNRIEYEPGPTVLPTVFRTRKHTMQDVSGTEDVMEPSRGIKRLRRVSAEVKTLTGDEDLSTLDDLALQSLHDHMKTVEKRPMEIISLSSNDDESTPDENIPIKHPRRARSFRRIVPMSSTGVRGNDSSMSNSISTDGSQPSSHPSAIRDIREEIRRAIRHIRRDDSAREKSAEQMNVLIAVMTAETDLVITMKTGGGKSMSWMVPSVMDEEARSIVVCPFVALLNEQYRVSVASGLRCHNYCISKVVPENVQILFVQVEHCSSHAFSK